MLEAVISWAREPDNLATAKAFDEEAASKEPTERYCQQHIGGCLRWFTPVRGLDEDLSLIHI